MKADSLNVQLQKARQKPGEPFSTGFYVIQIPYRPQIKRLALIALSPHSAHTIGMPS